jgi:hypothetical protein
MRSVGGVHLTLGRRLEQLAAELRIIFNGAAIGDVSLAVSLARCKSSALICLPPELPCADADRDTRGGAAKGAEKARLFCSVITSTAFDVVSIRQPPPL